MCASLLLSSAATTVLSKVSHNSVFDPIEVAATYTAATLILYCVPGVRAFA